MAGASIPSRGQGRRRRISSCSPNAQRGEQKLPPPPLLADGMLVLVILDRGEASCSEGFPADRDSGADRVYSLLPACATAGDLRRRNGMDNVDFVVTLPDGRVVGDDCPLAELLPAARGAAPAVSSAPKAERQREWQRDRQQEQQQLGPVDRAAALGACGGSASSSSKGEASAPILHLFGRSLVRGSAEQPLEHGVPPPRRRPQHRSSDRESSVPPAPAIPPPPPSLAAAAVASVPAAAAAAVVAAVETLPEAAKWYADHVFRDGDQEDETSVQTAQPFRQFVSTGSSPRTASPPPTQGLSPEVPLARSTPSVDVSCMAKTAAAKATSSPDSPIPDGRRHPRRPTSRDSSRVGSGRPLSAGFGLNLALPEEEAAAVESIQQLGAELQAQLVEIERLRYLLGHPRESTTGSDPHCSPDVPEGVGQPIHACAREPASAAMRLTSREREGPSRQSSRGGDHAAIAAEVNRQIRKVRSDLQKALRDEMKEHVVASLLAAIPSSASASSDDKLAINSRCDHTSVAPLVGAAVTDATAAFCKDSVGVAAAKQVCEALPVTRGEVPAAPTVIAATACTAGCCKDKDGSGIALAKKTILSSPFSRGSALRDHSSGKCCNIESGSCELRCKSPPVGTRKVTTVVPALREPNCRRSTVSGAFPLSSSAVAASPLPPRRSTPASSPLRPAQPIAATTVDLGSGYRAVPLPSRASVSPPPRHAVSPPPTPLGCCARAVSARPPPRTRRMLVGPFPQVTWAYYEVAEPVPFVVAA